MHGKFKNSNAKLGNIIGNIGTYNPALPNISRIIQKHSNVPYSSGRCKNVFTNLPLVAYRRCKSISGILGQSRSPSG